MHRTGRVNIQIRRKKTNIPNKNNNLPVKTTIKTHTSQTFPS